MCSQAVTPLRGSCGVSVSGFEEKGDANDQHRFHCWKQPLVCVSMPTWRRRSERCTRQLCSSGHRGDDTLGVDPHTVVRGAAEGAAFLLSAPSAHRGGPTTRGLPEVRFLPAPRVLVRDESAKTASHVGICGLHTYTAHLVDRRFRRGTVS
jgi:hypothetical protein